MPEELQPKDARVAVAAREFFVLDVRDAEDWSENAEQIPGSTHIAAGEIDSRLDELPDDRKILVVSPDGEHSAEVAERIDGDGREAVSLEGGVEAWKKDGLMTQPSPDAAEPKDEDEPPHEEPGDEDEDEAGNEDEDEAGDEDEAEDEDEAGDEGAER